MKKQLFIIFLLILLGSRVFAQVKPDGNLAMEHINQATAQSLAATRQAEKAAQDLNDLARSLAEIVEQYQL